MNTQKGEFYEKHPHPLSMIFDIKSDAATPIEIYQELFFYPNDFGASIIGPLEGGKYELCVLRATEEDRRVLRGQEHPLNNRSEADKILHRISCLRAWRGIEADAPAFEGEGKPRRSRVASMASVAGAGR